MGARIHSQRLNTPSISDFEDEIAALETTVSDTASDVATLQGQVGWVRLESQSGGGAGNVNIATDIGFATTYEHFMLVGNQIAVQTDDVELRLRVSEDAGANFSASDTDYQYTFKLLDPTTDSAVGSAATSVIRLGQGSAAGAAVGNATDESANFVLRFFRPFATDYFKHFHFECSYNKNNGDLGFGSGSGLYIASTNPVNAIQIVAESGNIAAGEFDLYGLRTG